MNRLDFKRYDFMNDRHWSDDVCYRETHYGLKLYPNGTNNCQLTICGNTEHFMHGKVKKIVIEELREVYRQTNKPLLFVDVHLSQAKRFRGIFPAGCIKVDSPYISSNSHKMVIMVLDMRCLNERTRTGSYRIK